MNLYIYNPQQYINMLLDNIQYKPIIGENKELGAKLTIGEDYIETYAWRIDFEVHITDPLIPYKNKLIAFLKTKKGTRRNFVIALNQYNQEHIPLYRFSQPIIKGLLRDINYNYCKSNPALSFPVGQIVAFPKKDMNGSIVDNQIYCLESLWYAYRNFLTDDPKKLWNFYLLYTVDKKAIDAVMEELTSKAKINISNYAKKAKGGLKIHEEYPWVTFGVMRLARRTMLGDSTKKAGIEEYIEPIKQYINKSSSYRKEAHEDYNGILDWYYDNY